VHEPHGENEYFAYDTMGRRALARYCTSNDGNFSSHLCKTETTAFNYVDGNIIERRGATNTFDTYRTISFSESGALGLFARTARNLTSPPLDPVTPEFCRFFFLNDSMGNVNATVDPNGNVEYQVFDAFGNLMGGGTMMNCDPASARMAASGRAQWRGAEGSQTDYNSSDLNANASEVNRYYWPTSHKRFTKKTSGLVFMQNRFYDPGTGRFTQKDILALGIETFVYGQNNRWVYCANDPVNCSDPTGLFSFSWAGAGMMAAGLAMIAAGVVTMAASPLTAFAGMAMIAGGMSSILFGLADMATSCKDKATLTRAALAFALMAAALTAASVVGAALVGAAGEAAVAAGIATKASLPVVAQGTKWAIAVGGLSGLAGGVIRTSQLLN